MVGLDLVSGVCTGKSRGNCYEAVTVTKFVASPW